MDDLISLIRAELESNIDMRTNENSSRFFKEDVKCYGVKTAIVSKIAKKYFNLVSEKSKNEIYSYCEELLISDYLEESFIAFKWAYSLKDQYEPEDFAVFERWIGDYVNNWAKCDTLCNHTIGTFIQMYPQYIDSLKNWASSQNRWYRRAAAVSLIVPARKGEFFNEILEIADMLLTDDDDLVRKGYGWMLKEASREHQQEIFEYVMQHKKIMPRTSLRYAIEKFPKDMRNKAMEK
ncbi:DNA alkylation repair protein [Methanosalsum natronophilum]|uniref:DNA alkylation repair protein n=1 Tax=Methanosalsum natronophilum TaxID=768733 RepID=A0A424Z3F5_9EURY|nr:MAG: DNA alkylation repair protein [Methanosalsum natronophilum]